MLAATETVAKDELNSRSVLNETPDDTRQEPISQQRSTTEPTDQKQQQQHGHLPYSKEVTQLIQMGFPGKRARIYFEMTNNVE